MFTEFMFIALVVYLLLGACSGVALAYRITFGALLKQRTDAGLGVILVTEIKNSLELKYVALRGHQAFGFQMILIRTRASDSLSDVDSFWDLKELRCFYYKWCQSPLANHLSVSLMFTF